MVTRPGGGIFVGTGGTPIGGGIEGSDDGMSDCIVELVAREVESTEELRDVEDVTGSTLDIATDASTDPPLTLGFKLICILGFWLGYAGGASEKTESNDTLGATLGTGISPGGGGSSSSRFITSGGLGSAASGATGSSVGGKSKPGMISVRLGSNREVSEGSVTGFDTVVVSGSSSSSEKSIAVGE